MTDKELIEAWSEELTRDEVEFIYSCLGKLKEFLNTVNVQGPETENKTLVSTSIDEVRSKIKFFFDCE